MSQRIELSLTKTTPKQHKWLAKLKAKWTLWLDPDTGCFTDDRPAYKEIDQLIRMNTIIYVYSEEDTISNCKYVGRLGSGELKIGWLTLKDAIEDTDFDILEFTEKCKELYLSEVIEYGQS